MKELTLEEMLQGISSGDVSCMVLLGNYIMNQESLDMSERMNQALPWYEKAAVAGNITAADLAMQIWEIKAHVYKKICAWETAIENYEKALNYINIILTNCGTDKNSKDPFLTKKQENCYQIAYCYYRSEDLATTLNILDNNSELKGYIKADMLRAICFFDLAKGPIDFDEAQKLLRVYETCDGSALSDITDPAEEVTLAMGYIHLSILYREYRTPDYKSAFNVLTKGRRSVKVDEVKEMFNDELKHYSVNLFGKFQYIP